ncbi:Glycyl-tRNA synthetase [Giardia muris]|uniref:glycine--tRNA ligase n=1 Tax=Giardia muris TaxID=5742 RepID=A0A4Z1TCN9_GIAMU|nr:Glycyl-tRNA synthetase [Giardia muris]|eukprot:TNJ30261.1 Glycyl-tRNA synthetase [Giardia muris]
MSSETLLNNVLLRRFFVVPAFEIYGGVSGLYDLGPSGVGLCNNLISLWRRHFIEEDELLEVSCTNLVPEKVLVSSGHVARFADVMVKDTTNGECFRADKLIERHLEKLLLNEKLPADERVRLTYILNSADGSTPEQIKQLILDLGVLSPSGNPLSDPFYFNLMFQTSIGPASNMKVYLRPETAQGIFMNFKRGLEYAKRLPFGMAQVGSAFRNEISPRNGLIRVREFEQCEIEYFTDGTPNGLKHPRFSSVAKLCVELLSAEDQLAGKERGRNMLLSEALSTGLLRHETMGYFLGRIYLFLKEIGLDTRRLRFRQHLPQQLAHYASDCWDCDCLLSCGWTEIVGLADRSAYDLKVHSEASGADLTAFVHYPEPRQVEYDTCSLVKRACASIFKKDTVRISEAIAGLQGDRLAELKLSVSKNEPYVLEFDDCSFEILPSYVEFSSGSKTVHGESIIPHVIEPSFGIGRILYSLLEHTFHIREEDSQRTIFRFVPQVAGIKVFVLPLMSNDQLLPVAERFCTLLRRRNVSTRIDSSASLIGRRYARADEIGTPFCVTVDYETLENDSVTIRERDTMMQVRVPGNQTAHILADLCEGRYSWEAIRRTYLQVVSDKTETEQ